MEQLFPELKKKLGFGCMRLPMRDGQIDYEMMNHMTDFFIARGFNYFDTAHGYHNGMSEVAIGKCVAARHQRSEFVLTNKLTGPYFETNADIRPFFEKQLETCGVDYFDFYLMHAQGRNNYDKFRRARAYETAFELKREGRVRHVGISFHDTPEMLARILRDYPELEVVQIQFNYWDYDDAVVQGRRCLEVCEKYRKPVIVMEPVKGGSLARLPEAAQQVFDSLGDASYASYAIRFAAGFEQVVMVLSGMSHIAQMVDNVSYMIDFKPLDAEEEAAVSRVAEILSGIEHIPCTACRYCIEENECPANISIPDLFSCMNSLKRFRGWNARMYYHEVYTLNKGKASDCLECGGCELACPQHLEIRKLLKQVAAEFERRRTG